jgi:hypothetical protein
MEMWRRGKDIVFSLILALLRGTCPLYFRIHTV